MGSCSTAAGLVVEDASEGNGWRVGGEWSMPGHPSRGYHGLIKAWLLRYKAQGDFLLVGEEMNTAGHFAAAFGSACTITTCDINGRGTMTWDVTRPGPVMAHDVVVCQAVLEHVLDPVAALRYMAQALRPGGLMVVHTHGVEMPEHDHPVDCWRLMPGALALVGAHLCLDVLDTLSTPRHVFAAYRTRGARA
jgi:hypothetical protein